MQNFITQVWNILAQQDWEQLGHTEDVNQMANTFTHLVNKALDICAPIKNAKTLYRAKQAYCKTLLI